MYRCRCCLVYVFRLYPIHVVFNDQLIVFNSFYFLSNATVKETCKTFYSKLQLILQPETLSKLDYGLFNAKNLLNFNIIVPNPISRWNIHRRKSVTIAHNIKIPKLSSVW